MIASAASLLMITRDYAEWRVASGLFLSALRADHTEILDIKGTMRTVALVRKNWIHVGSEEAGPKIAAILSVLKTWMRLKVNARDYLKNVLPKLGI
jgi:hypothetical protein